MTAITRAALVQRVRWELGDQPWEDTGTAASASSTITGVSTGDWAEGDIGEFVADGDTFRTTSEAAGTITAVRSYDGSTGASHAASSRIYKFPRYRYNVVTNAIEGVIQDLPWPRVYKGVTATPLTPDPAATIWYDLDVDARALIKVTQAYGPSDVALGFFGMRHTSPRVVFERNLPTSMVASTVGLQFPDGFYHDSNDVNVEFAAKVTDAGTTDYDDLQEGDTLVEAVIYGAVARLEAGLEQGKPRQPRQDRETLRGANLYESKYHEALNRVTSELRATIPLMGTRKF